MKDRSPMEDGSINVSGVKARHIAAAHEKYFGAPGRQNHQGR